MNTFLGLSPQVQIVLILCSFICVLALMGGAMFLLLTVAKSRRAANNISTFVSGFVRLSRSRDDLQIGGRHTGKQKLPLRTKN